MHHVTNISPVNFLMEKNTMRLVSFDCKPRADMERYSQEKVLFLQSKHLGYNGEHKASVILLLLYM